MTEGDWDAGFARSIGMFLNGDAIPNRDERGQPVVDDSFMVILNAHDENLEWVLPRQWGGSEGWEIEIQTCEDVPRGSRVGSRVKAKVTVGGRGLVVLRRPRSPDPFRI
jgi:glycogen operon protein